MSLERGRRAGRQRERPECIFTTPDWHIGAMRVNYNGSAID